MAPPILQFPWRPSSPGYSHMLQGRLSPPPHGYSGYCVTVALCPPFPNLDSRVWNGETGFEPATACFDGRTQPLSYSRSSSSIRMRPSPVNRGRRPVPFACGPALESTHGLVGTKHPKEMEPSDRPLSSLSFHTGLHLRRDSFPATSALRTLRQGRRTPPRRLPGSLSDSLVEATGGLIHQQSHGLCGEQHLSAKRQTHLERPFPVSIDSNSALSISSPLDCAESSRWIDRTAL